MTGCCQLPPRKLAKSQTNGVENSVANVAWVRAVNVGKLVPNPRAGDPVSVVRRPAHGVTVSMALLAFTVKPQMLEDLLAAGEDLPPGMRHEINTRLESRHR
jgi:MOSC domain-containing protein YiiM